jgi:hypothetical protein
VKWTIAAVHESGCRTLLTSVLFLMSALRQKLPFRMAAQCDCALSRTPGSKRGHATPDS